MSNPLLPNHDKPSGPAGHVGVSDVVGRALADGGSPVVLADGILATKKYIFSN